MIGNRSLVVDLDELVKTQVKFGIDDIVKVL